MVAVDGIGRGVAGGLVIHRHRPESGRHRLGVGQRRVQGERVFIRAGHRLVVGVQHAGIIDRLGGDVRGEAKDGDAEARQVVRAGVSGIRGRDHPPVFQGAGKRHGSQCEIADGDGRLFHLLEDERVHVLRLPLLAEFDAEILKLREHRVDLALRRRIFVQGRREDGPELQRIVEFHVAGGHAGLHLGDFVFVSNRRGCGPACVLGKRLERDGLDHFLGLRQIGFALRVHPRLELDPARRAVNARDAIRQRPFPARPDERELAALVAGRSPGGVGECGAIHVADFDHVVTAVRIRRGEDDGLGPQVRKAESVNHIEVRRDVARLRGELGRRDVLHPPDGVGSGFRIGADSDRGAQVIHRHERRGIGRSLDGERFRPRLDGRDLLGRGGGRRCGGRMGADQHGTCRKERQAAGEQVLFHDCYFASAACFMASSSFLISSGGSCGRSTLIVSLSSLAVSGNGGR